MEFLVLKTTFYLRVLIFIQQSLLAKSEFMTMDSDRMCCVRLSTNVGFICVFNVHFPCDNSTQCNLQLYIYRDKMHLNDIITNILHQFHANCANTIIAMQTKHETLLHVIPIIDSFCAQLKLFWKIF